MRSNDKILLVFGMQNDYVKDRGIISKIEERVKWYEENQYPYYFTQDTYFSPSFCQIHTDGWKFVNELEKYTLKNNVVKTFDSLANLFWGDVIISSYSTVELCGLYTDINVVSNALVLRAKNPNTKFIVCSELCQGTSTEKHDSALDILESNGIEVILRRDI